MFPSNEIILVEYFSQVFYGIDFFFLGNPRYL